VCEKKSYACCLTLLEVENFDGVRGPLDLGLCPRGDPPQRHHGPRAEPTRSGVNYCEVSESGWIEKRRERCLPSDLDPIPVVRRNTFPHYSTRVIATDDEGGLLECNQTDKKSTNPDSRRASRLQHVAMIALSMTVRKRLRTLVAVKFQKSSMRPTS